jgi:hypothetical protein
MADDKEESETSASTLFKDVWSLEDIDTHVKIMQCRDLSLNPPSAGCVISRSDSEESSASDCSLSNDNYETYQFRAKICTRLSRELKLAEIQYDCDEGWIPPEEHGLNNCDYILPAYYHYHKMPDKIVDIDYYEIIKDDIRNYRVLNKYQLKYIADLPDELKTELFRLFNECTIAINEMLNSTK